MRLIDADAVLDKLNEWEWQELYLPIHFKENIIDVLPSVTPTQNCVENALSALDCISRQAVEEIINDIRDCISVEGYCAILERLKKLPPVNPQEPKTGCWIENAPEYQNIDPPYICSECGNMHLRKTNYCDQCGARMVEPQESEE